MDICFIPGYACRGSIFDAVLKDFESAFAVDWPLEQLSQFKSHKDFCDWICAHYEKELQGCKALVGHSLGGGLAFYLSMRPQFKNVQVVLIDYFLNMPPPFFRNYCSEFTSPEILDAITDMMAKTKPFFNPEVLQSFVEYTPQLLVEREQLNGKKLKAIYGMRSSEDTSEVEKELVLPEEMKALLELHFIPKAAHFPTVERPQAFAKLLAQILA